MFLKHVATDKLKMIEGENVAKSKSWFPPGISFIVIKIALIPEIFQSNLFISSVRFW